MCGTFPLEANLLIVSFLSTSSACCIHSFGSPVLFGVCLSHIFSRCPEEMETFCLFHWVWSPCGHLLLHCLSRASDCGFLPLLGLGGFSILNIIHLCSLLHSLQMLLFGDFQPSYLHYSVWCHLMTPLSQSWP